MKKVSKRQQALACVSLEPLVAVEDLERLLRVHRRTVSRLCKDGKFPKPFKLGGQNRWRARDIAAVLDGPGVVEQEVCLQKLIKK